MLKVWKSLDLRAAILHMICALMCNDITFVGEGKNQSGIKLKYNYIIYLFALFLYDLIETCIFLSGYPINNKHTVLFQR